MYTSAWCSEIGLLRSVDAPELHASSDVREPISLHQAVCDTAPAVRKLIAYESSQMLEYEIFTRRKISAITVLVGCGMRSTDKQPMSRPLAAEKEYVNAIVKRSLK